MNNYGCALQKEILVQGRLYIAEDHVCFNANIFGWVTNLIIAFSEVTAIEKRMTAFVIPNAISIVTTTNTKGHFFASFLSRDAAHDLLFAAWRKSFPCAANATAINGPNQFLLRQTRSPNLSINNNDDDTESLSSSSRGLDFYSGSSRKNRHRRSFSNASNNWDDSNGHGEDWDESMNDDSAAHEKNNNSVGVRRRGSKRAVVKKLLKDVIAPIIPDDDNKSGALLSHKRTGRVRSISELPPRPTSFDGAGSTFAPANRRESIAANRSSLDQDALSPTVARARAATESLSPRQADIVTKAANNIVNSASTSGGAHAVRKPTTCKCSKDGRHYTNVYMNETYPGTLESIWKLLFDSDFSKQFLTGDAMKGADVQEEKWVKGSSGSEMTKVTKYIKWLGMPIGPKTTKAILTDVCEHKDVDNFITTVTTTSTPDVPSGGCFTTKCRTCLTWAGPNKVNVVVTGAVEFTKSSWIKGTIEKGAAEGMAAHYKELNLAIRKHIAEHPKDFAGSAGTTGSHTMVPADTSAGAATVPRSPHDQATVVSTHQPQEQLEEQPGRKHHEQSQSTEKNRQQRGSGKGGNAQHSTDLWKSLVQSFQSTARGGGGGEGIATHAALVLILLIVMVVNVYIWYQIASVNTQISQIQGNLALGAQHGKAGSSYVQYDPRSQNNRHGYDGEKDDLFVREQEEAMWAWLTEREARHRQYRRHYANWEDERRVAEQMNKKKKTTTRCEEEEEDGDDEEYDKDGEEDGQRWTTETKLKAKIDELQMKLEALERQALSAQLDAHEVDKVISL
ncbi:hypothetical protein BG004_001615 [Podila humilis]|nr:hypothetical protein BG004_001615 [Podila humilis]